MIIDNPQGYRLFDSLPENRRMYLPAVNHEEFPYLLNQVDVLLVPLRNTPYNNSLPDTVLMKAGARGIPWVASSIPSFRSWRSGGIICDSLNEWHLNVRQLVMDRDLRQKLGREGMAMANMREMTSLGKLWLDAIDQVTHAGISMMPANTALSYKGVE